MNYCVVAIECSGSTFVWQIVNTLTKKKPKKAHTYIPPRKCLCIFFTYRDPRDIICSYGRRLFAGKVRKEGIEKALITGHNALFKQHKRHLLVNKYLALSDNNIHIIKYEDYFGGKEGELYDFIADIMKIKSNYVLKEKILSKFSLEENKKRADKLQNFGKFDKKTHIHGNHISSNGKIGVWKDLFTDKVKNIVKNDIGKFIIDLGYEKDMEW